MKTVALFLALSLSIGSVGCGVEQDGTKPSDDHGMTGKMDDPFAGSDRGPEGPLAVKMALCKTDVYFYESKDGKSINWFGFWNKNDVIVHAYVYETNITASVAWEILQPSQKGGGNLHGYGVERGHIVTVYVEKLDSTGRNLLPCEETKTTMP